MALGASGGSDPRVGRVGSEVTVNASDKPRLAGKLYRGRPRTSGQPVALYEVYSVEPVVDVTLVNVGRRVAERILMLGSSPTRPINRL